MSLLSLEQKQNALRSQVFSLIKSNLKKWCSDRDVYGDNIMDMQCIINSLLDEKHHVIIMFSPELFLKHNIKYKKDKQELSNKLIEKFFDTSITHLGHLTNDHITILKEWLEIKGLW